MMRSPILKLVIGVLLINILIICGCATAPHRQSGGTIIGNPDQTKSVVLPEKEQPPKRQNPAEDATQNPSKTPFATPASE